MPTRKSSTAVRSAKTSPKRSAKRSAKVSVRTSSKPSAKRSPANASSAKSDVSSTWALAVAPAAAQPATAAKPLPRCFWAEGDALLAGYHDEEWGVPVHDDRRWFEKIVLDGAQAGLSWLTILRKREGYREAFAGFDPAAVARFTARDAARLLKNPGIVRNRAKIKSAIENARAFLRIQAEHGSFDTFIWSFVDGKTVQGSARDRHGLPARTDLSDRISKELRDRGFTFVGSTIVYAFMQASGLVNDHLTGCFRRSVVARLR